MARPKRATAAGATAGNENESSEQVNSSDVALARSALFAAVESDERRYDRDDDDDDDNNSKMKDDSPLSQRHLTASTTRSFLALFDSSKKSGAGTKTMIKDGITPSQQRKLLLTAITNFSTGQARRFFGALANIVQQVNDTAAYLPDLQQQQQQPDGDDDDDLYVDDEDDDEKEIILSEQSLDDLRFLRLAAGCLQKYIERLSKKRGKTSRSSKLELHIIDEAYDVAVYLHNILFELNSCGSQAQPTQAAIVDLCEAWWHAQARDREHLIVQCLPILALNAVKDTMPPLSTVKRLWEIRHALHAIDFDDEDSSHSIRTIFLSIASSALCLKVPEGRRLLAYIFHVHASLMMDLHEAIRVQIPGASKMELAAYGEIYYLAWKEAAAAHDNEQTAIRDAMETHVLSDLVDAALRLENPAMWTSIMTVLRPFYNNNKTAEVEDLLLRLFGPVLWRSLQATDAKIRINAAHILAEVFPLQDSSHKNSKDAIDKSCMALSVLLQDEDPHVRVAGSAAVAKILLVFWDAVPSTDIRMLLNHVVVQHASDTKSAVVRAGALNSITLLLLENPHSHGVLRPLLPSLGNLIHDKVEKVRLTAARMLHSIGKAGIRYDNVVPVEHLTSRLEEEGHRNATGSIASALTSLLLDFYLPQGPAVTGTDVMERTLPFLEHYPAAAKFFYANLVHHLPIEAVVKLVSMLLLCLNAAVEKEQEQDIKKKSQQQQQKPRGRKSRRLSTSESDAENSNNSDDAGSALSASHISLMATLVEVIGILWQSIEFDLYHQPQNAVCKDFLLGKFSGPTLTNLLTHFASKAAATTCENRTRRDDYHRTCTAILHCAGLMPPDMVDGLVPSVVSVLNSVSQGDCDRQQQGSIAPYLALFCHWNMVEEVASSLASSIEAFFENDRSSLFSCSTSGPRRRKTRRSDNKQKQQPDDVVPRLPSRVALEGLRDIMRGSDPNTIAARESILGSPTSSNVIGASLERGLQHAERLFGPDSIHGHHSFTEAEAEFAFLVCETFYKFTLHQQVLAPNDCMKIGHHAERLLSWITAKLVPAFRPPLGDLDISRISMDRCSGISLSASGISLLESGNKRSRDEDDVSCSTMARALRVSIMQAACVVFSEWLAVGASSSSSSSSSSAEPIATAATAWCKIFELEEGRREIQAGTLPAFSRLALQLGKQTQSFDVVKQILLHCKDDSGDEGNIFRSALSKLTSTKGAIATRVVGCVLDVAHELATRPKVAIPYDLPSSVSSLWPRNSVGCIRIGVAAVLGSKCASLALGKKLLDKLRDRPTEKDKVDDGVSETRTLVDLRLLSCMLSDENSKARNEVTSMVRGQINVDCFDEKSQLRPVVEKLLTMIG
jgi:condensin-2 complex subunit G2